MAHIDTLVIVDGSPVSYATLEALLNDHFKTSLKECVFSGTDVLNTKKETYTKALCHPNSPYSMEQLASMLKIMKPGGTVIFYAPDAEGLLRRNCILSGFLVSENDSTDANVLKVKKPEWNMGAKSEIKSQPPSKWTVTVDDDDEVLDDDEFLTEEDLKLPQTQDGKVPVKKACENCTCGRAEGKEPIKLTQEMIDNPVTSCGSCGLGDAYRCASCPYRGLPAFESGKKIEVPEGFLVPDH